LSALLELSAERTPAWVTVKVRHALSWNWLSPAIAVACTEKVVASPPGIVSWYQPFLLTAAPCSSPATQSVAPAIAVA
jgi:hypothetical protein